MRKKAETSCRGPGGPAVPSMLAAFTSVRSGARRATGRRALVLSRRVSELLGELPPVVAHRLDLRAPAHRAVAGHVHVGVEAEHVSSA